MSKKVVTKDGLVPYNYNVQDHTIAICDENMVLAFTDEYISHIEGRVLTLIEGLISELGERQHPAIKSLVRDALWGNMHNGWACPMTKDKWNECVLDSIESN